MDKRQRRVAEFIEPFRVRPGSKVTLGKDFDPAFKAGVKKKKKEGVALLAEGVRLLSEYQARLAAQDTWGVLVVLQAMDTAGKDGTIRHLMSGVNAQGVAVHSFKVPSAEELDHDFLWRYPQRLPARPDIGIFSRSHYEEVLVVRVHPENLDRQRLPKASKKGDIAMNALKAMVKASARVRRDGSDAEIAAEEVVVGDVVLLAAGDEVPADGRMIQASSLQTDESGRRTFACGWSPGTT